jgi:hypothetical protein
VPLPQSFVQIILLIVLHGEAFYGQKQDSLPDKR